MGPRTDRRETPARRVGVFGGTFDPPHLGHASAARDVADALGLDAVLWVPARVPPHKIRGDITPAEVRLEMTRAATASDERFEVSDVEITRPGPSYTVDTLRELAGPELYLIVGYDQFAALDSWREPCEILSRARLVVMDRDGSGVPEEPGADTHAPEIVRRLAAQGDLDETILRVPVGRVDISSTLVRERVREGLDVSDLVAPAVKEIILAERLYKGRDVTAP